MRSPAVLALAALLLVPLVAQAGKPKSPFHALVNADGTSASSVLFSQRSTPGQPGVYVISVIGRPDILGCVAFASPAGGGVGTIGVWRVSDHYFVVQTTVGTGAALTDMPFYIVVHCPKWESSG
jgi:hypothetical protein